MFSPDGARIVTASDDGTARLWDVATARELTALLSLPDSWAQLHTNGDVIQAGLNAWKYIHGIEPPPTDHGGW